MLINCQVLESEVAKSPIKKDWAHVFFNVINYTSTGKLPVCTALL